MEGPEAATKLGILIKLTLGQMNAIDFLTTKLSDILDDTPKPDDGATLYQIYSLLDCSRVLQTELACFRSPQTIRWDLWPTGAMENVQLHLRSFGKFFGLS